MYSRLDKLARKASTITESIVKPAFKHLETQQAQNLSQQPEGEKIHSRYEGKRFTLKSKN